MFLHPQFFFALLAATVLIYWAIPRSQARLRAYAVIAFSIAAVLAASLHALLLVFASTLIAVLSTRALARRPDTGIAAAFVVAQIVIMIIPDALGWFSLNDRTIIFVGVAYFTLKSISVTIDALKYQKAVSFLDVLTLNIFYPIFSAGPIEQLTTFSAKAFDVSFDPQAIVKGASRMAIGFFKYLFVADMMINNYLRAEYPAADASWTQVDSGAAYLFIVLKWLALFLSFSGYTDIAIGSARMLNVTIRENFNKPYLARSIQSYWQRWHMSLMNFMSKYVYLNYVRRSGRRIVGIYLVFFAAGLWHAITVNYLVWAIAHGSAMAGFAAIQRTSAMREWNERISKNFFGNIIFDIASRVTTISFVCVVSAIGTSHSWAEAVKILSALWPWS